MLCMSELIASHAPFIARPCAAYKRTAVPFSLPSTGPIACSLALLAAPIPHVDLAATFSCCPLARLDPLFIHSHDLGWLL